MAVGDAYRLDLYQLFAGQRIMNSLAFYRKSASTPTQAECLALAMDWKDHLKQHQVSQLSHTGWRVQQLTGSGVTYPAGQCKRVGGMVFEGSYTGVVIGTLTGDGVPPQCAVVTTLKTGLSGRSKRGRFYQAGLPESNQVDGSLGGGVTAAYQAAWDVQLNKFKGAGTDLIWGLGVWSQTIATGCKPSLNHPHTPTSVLTPDPGTALTNVTSVVCRSIVYSQRRRTVGVGM